MYNKDAQVMATLDVSSHSSRANCILKPNPSADGCGSAAHRNNAIVSELSLTQRRKPFQTPNITEREWHERSLEAEIVSLQG